MDKKQCKECGEEKPLTEYYKHKSYPDGRMRKCKKCKKEYQRKRHRELMKDPKWVEKERKRGRDKYHRLYAPDYVLPVKGRRKCVEEHRERYPEKYNARNISQRILKKGYHKHHWSYKEKHAKDVIFLKPKQHSKAHEFMVYDQDHFQYRGDKGNLLDTKEKHIEYLKRKGVKL